MDYTLAMDGLPTEVRAENLRLPDGFNPDSRALAQQWLAELEQKAGWEYEYLLKVQQLFNKSFIYTLQPPALGRNSIDEFLFDTQRGFCEHYASSFVFLMRVAGIPARVVIGYQGGQYNEEDEYLIVRQRDAHAWAEVWIEGQGWKRVDPTAAVAPSRIEEGIGAAIPDEEASLVPGARLNTGIWRSINWVQLRIDNLSYTWHSWVLSYDNEAQAGFFKRYFGGSAAWKIGLFFIVGCGLTVVLVLLIGSAGLKRRYQYSEAEIYARHLRYLSRFGFDKAPAESPTQFAQRVAEIRPLWREQLIGIAQLYSSIAFNAQDNLKEQFALACRNFRLNKKP